MSLSDIRELILRNRRRLLGALVGMVAVAIGLSFFFQRAAEVSEEEKIPPLNLSQENKGIIALVDLSELSPISPPPAAMIYQVSKIGPIFTQTEAGTVAHGFGFSTLTREVATPRGKIFIFSKSGEDLAVVSNPRALRYTRESVGGGGALPAEAVAIRNAREFLAAKNLPDPGSAAPVVRYLNDFGERMEEVAREESRFVEIILPWSVAGVDILGEGLTDAAARLVFDSTGQLVHLAFKFEDYSFTPSRSVPLKNFDATVAGLRGEAQVVLIRPVGGTRDWTIPDPPDLNSFTPESLRLIYVKQSQGELLYPVYLFEGSGRVRGVDVRAAVYVLAVSDQYIKEE